MWVPGKWLVWRWGGEGVRDEGGGRVGAERMTLAGCRPGACACKTRPEARPPYLAPSPCCCTQAGWITHSQNAPSPRLDSPATPTQVGWMTGPSRLLIPIVKAHQFLVFTVPSSLQRAVAHGLDKESDFY